jgi:hypothetical protein
MRRTNPSVTGRRCGTLGSCTSKMLVRILVAILFFSRFPDFPSDRTFQANSAVASVLALPATVR